MQHPTHAHGGFQLLSSQNSLLILSLIEKHVFNSNVHQTSGTTSENCLIYSLLPPSARSDPLGVAPQSTPPVGLAPTWNKSQALLIPRDQSQTMQDL